MKITTRYLICVISFTWMLVLGGCSALQRMGSGKTQFGKETTAGQITQAELQDDLLRFESQFNARIQDADVKLETSDNPKIRYRAELNRIVYYTNSLGIALGPNPESNLLDMVTFTELSRAVYEDHWLPQFFGRDGEAISQAFKDSSEQIWGIASKVLSPQQKQTLQKIISDWRSKHPNQIDVETVRLSAFSSQAGAKAAGLSEDVGGLFASVQQSTESVDSARLFAERALYYAQRIPFLLRYQSRLATSEILSEVDLTLRQSGSPFDHKQDFVELLSELQKTLLLTRATFGDMHSTLKTIEEMLTELQKHPQEASQVHATLAEVSALLRDWNRMVESPSSQNSVSQMAGVAARVEQEGDRLLNKLLWRGAALIAFFWFMALISKLSYRYLSTKFFPEVRPAGRDKQGGKAA